ncbi:MAG: hypothetical protein RML99_10535 [Anaerolineae bacterium]|nr:hypothetical protein [Anaerolineae bacterium]
MPSHPSAASLAARSVVPHHLLIFGSILLGVFALYAPAVGLMPLHDDAVNIFWLNGFTLTSIFGANWSQGGASARPMANALWILTRDLFGWYVPGIIHMWNVWLHVLNTALVIGLATRLGRRLGLTGTMFPALGGAIFAFFPLSYQAVIWAGAIYHPAMTAFGLLAIHTSLGLYARSVASGGAYWARWGICALCALAAALSHESGFMFGLLALWLNLVIRLPKRARPSLGVVGIAAVASLYPVVYRLALATERFGGQAAALLASPADVGPNAVYFAQSAVGWLVLLLRPIMGLTASAPQIILVGFVVAVGLACVLLMRQRAARLGLLALGWWGLLAALPTVTLSHAYVSFGPRLLYAPSVGVALFWGAVVTCALRAIKPPWLRRPALAGVALLLAWGAPYVLDRIHETARLTAAMTAVDRDLRGSDPNARVLFVNMPWWNAPRYPSFFIGAEGMPIFQHDGAPASTWIGAVSGTYRDTHYVRHEASLTYDARWQYGQPGPTVDDDGLRRAVFASTHVYRFDYDRPGLRAQRLALIQPAAAPPDRAIATLRDGAAQVVIWDVDARRCGEQIALDLGWWSNGRVETPVGVFVHGFNAQGERVVVADRDLLDGALPLHELPSGVLIRERRLIVAGAVEFVVELRVGVYRRDGLVRWQAVRHDGLEWPGGEVIAPVRASCDSE